MGDLRIAMILIGIVILIGIYVHYQWRSSKDVDEIFSERDSTEDVLLGPDEDDDQAFEAYDEGDGYEEEPALMGSGFARQDTLEEKVDPRLFDMQKTQEVTPMEHFEDTASGMSGADQGVIVMHLVAGEGQSFRGQAVLKALQVHKMRFGEFNIYHRIADDEGQPESVFSIANMVKPGTLSPVELPQTKLPGLTFFLRLPAIGGDLRAFDDMLHVAQQMAAVLDGTLNDEQFGLMTDATINSLRIGLG